MPAAMINFFMYCQFNCLFINDFYLCPPPRLLLPLEWLLLPLEWLDELPPLLDDDDEPE